MKFKQLTEAKYVGRAPEMFFVLEYINADDFKLVGPFPDSDHARNYEKMLNKKYGSGAGAIHFNTDVVGVTTPEDYEKEAAEFHKWQNDD